MIAVSVAKPTDLSGFATETAIIVVQAREKIMPPRCRNVIKPLSSVTRRRRSPLGVSGTLIGSTMSNDDDEKAGTVDPTLDDLYDKIADALRKKK